MENHLLPLFLTSLFYSALLREGNIWKSFLNNQWLFISTNARQAVERTKGRAVLLLPVAGQPCMDDSARPRVWLNQLVSGNLHHDCVAFPDWTMQWNPDEWDHFLRGKAFPNVPMKQRAKLRSFNNAWWLDLVSPESTTHMTWHLFHAHREGGSGVGRDMVYLSPMKFCFQILASTQYLKIWHFIEHFIAHMHQIPRFAGPEIRIIRPHLDVHLETIRLITLSITTTKKFPVIQKS